MSYTDEKLKELKKELDLKAIQDILENPLVKTHVKNTCIELLKFIREKGINGGELNCWYEKDEIFYTDEELIELFIKEK